MRKKLISFLWNYRRLASMELDTNLNQMHFFNLKSKPGPSHRQGPGSPRHHGLKAPKDEVGQRQRQQETGNPHYMGIARGRRKTFRHCNGWIVNNVHGNYKAKMVSTKINSYRFHEKIEQSYIPQPTLMTLLISLVKQGKAIQFQPKHLLNYAPSIYIMYH